MLFHTHCDFRKHLNWDAVVKNQVFLPWIMAVRKTIVYTEMLWKQLSIAYTWFFLLFFLFFFFLEASDATEQLFTCRTFIECVEWKNHVDCTVEQDIRWMMKEKKSIQWIKKKSNVYHSCIVTVSSDSWTRKNDGTQKKQIKNWLQRCVMCLENKVYHRHSR